jgi:hypothetical protein
VVQLFEKLLNIRIFFHLLLSMVLFCSLIPLQLDPFCTACTSSALCSTRHSYCLQQHAHTMHLSPVHVPLHQVLLQLELFSGPSTHHLPSAVLLLLLILSPPTAPCARSFFPCKLRPATPHPTISLHRCGSAPTGRSAHTRCR